MEKKEGSIVNTEPDSASVLGTTQKIKSINKPEKELVPGPRLEPISDEIITDQNPEPEAEPAPIPPWIR
tara:strand:+ start:115 stop:321 length:207 start_codon:yes stop_codon:yes gene_type:complete